MKSSLTVFTVMLMLLTSSFSYGAVVYTDLGDGVTPALYGSKMTRRADYTFTLPMDDTADEYLARYGLHDTKQFMPKTGFITKRAYIENISTFGTLDSDNETWLAYKLDSGVAVGAGSSFLPGKDRSFLYVESTKPEDDHNALWENMTQAETGFIGFVFNYEDDHFYGWAELGINSDTGMFTVYGYAYDDTPGTEVLTGDTGSPVPVPGAVWLLGSGFMGLVGLRCRAGK